MAETRYQVVMHAGPTPGKIFPLEKNETFIGRDLTNDIVINDAEISRRHARLIAQAGGYVLEDLGSTNGTFVNGQRLMGPYVLQLGETITLGEHVSVMVEPVFVDPDATVVGQSFSPNPAVNPTANAVPMPPPPPQQPAYVPPAYVPPTYVEPIQAPPPPPVPPPSYPPPSYSGQVAQGPALVVEPPPPAKKRSSAAVIIIIIVVLLLLLCACGAFFYYVDANALWCKFFTFIPGCAP